MNVSSSFFAFCCLLASLLAVVATAKKQVVIPARPSDAAAAVDTAVYPPAREVMIDMMLNNETDNHLKPPDAMAPQPIVIHELGLDNFDAVIRGSTFTFCLFYDPHDTSDVLDKKHTVLQRLASSWQRQQQAAASKSQSKPWFLRHFRLEFATLDIRRHFYLRKTYLRWSGAAESAAYKERIQNWDDLPRTNSALPAGMVNATTFMNSVHVPPTLTSEFALFEGNFDILNCLDEEEKINDQVVDPTSYAQVQTWIMNQIRPSLTFYVKSHDASPLSQHAFLTDERPNMAIQSLIHKERTRQKEYYQESNPMESIDWKAVDQAAAELREKKNNATEHDKFSVDAFHIDRSDTAALTAAHPANSIDRSDAGLLNQIGNILEVILAAFDSYENLWSDERKAAEDEHTHYGRHLAKLEAGMRTVLLDVYDAVDDEDEDDDDSDDNEWRLFSPSEDLPIPLKRWFRDMVFGFGKSPSTLQVYLNEQVYTTHVANATKLVLVQRLRDFLTVREKLGQRKYPYRAFLRSTYLQLVALHNEFAMGLSESLASHPRAEQQEPGDQTADFGASFSKMDRWDMENPEHAALLSDYDAFSQRYLQQRQPVVLANVQMTHPYNFTQDFLVEKCGFVDVSSKIRTSFGLGDTSVTSWGGLEKFTLPREWMVVEQRRSTDKNGEEKWDTSISLEQFVALAERLDSLYLHDFSLKLKCAGLFWADSPYDADPSKQFFRIPSVIGRYDLFQRLASSGFAHSWPSLFIGRKGSNSKLHIDAGATGFWMYLVSGRKRWVIYDVAERPYLYQTHDSGRFKADVLAFNATQDADQRRVINNYFDAKHPLLRRASAGRGAYEYIQEPGDLVFIPPNSPHAVENLDDIVGLSFNLVPRDGIAAHLFNIVHRKREFGSLETILRYLMMESDRFDLVRSNPDDPLYTTFGEYLAQ